MPQFTVDTEEMRAKADLLSRTAADIENQLQELLVQINSMESSWQGTAATAMREFYAGFDARARAVNKELSEISQAMATAAANYDGTEASIMRAFQR